MRSLSADLRYAQQHTEPHAEVTALVKRRSTYKGDPLIWQRLAHDEVGNFLLRDAYDHDDGTDLRAAVIKSPGGGALLRALRSDIGASVWVQRVTNPLYAVGWAEPPVQVATLTEPYYVDDGLGGATDAELLGSVPALLDDDGTARCFWGDGNYIRWTSSTDDGVTWGNVGTVRNFGAPLARVRLLHAQRHAGTGNLLLFCTLEWDDGRITVRLLIREGTAWVDYGDAPTAVPWQVGVVFPSGADAYQLYLWGENYQWSSIVVWRLVYDGVTPAWDAAWQVVDRAGVTGGLAYDNVRGGEIGGVFALALTEVAARAYFAVSALAGVAGSRDMEEPVLLDDAVASQVSIARHEALTPIAWGRVPLLVGAGVIFYSLATQVDSWPGYDPLAVHELEVTRYIYQARGDDGIGHCELEFPYPVDADAKPQISNQVVLPGDIIWLKRTLSAHDPATGTVRGGTIYLPVRAYKIERRRDHVNVLAYDALGVLAHMRARRAKVFRTSDYGSLTQAASAILGWAGVLMDSTSAIEPAFDVLPEKLTWRANESAYLILFRLLRTSRAVMRTRLAVGLDHTAAQIMMTTSTSADYVYELQYVGRTEPLGGHRVQDWAFVWDGREPRLFAGEALVVANDPATGAVVYNRFAEVAPGVFPLTSLRRTPVYYIDRSLASGMRDIVDSEARRLGMLLNAGWVETVANLGLEVFDLIEVDGWRYRVRAIDERWEQGELRQRVHLAQFEESAGFGPYE